MKKWIFLVLVTVMITGCNTVTGVGKDLERGGEAIQRAAH
jgi:entericidin B